MELQEGYKLTEVGVIPEDWDVKTLANISENVMVGIASAATHAYRDAGIILFRNQNIKNGYLDDSDVLFISEEYEVLFKNKRLKLGDLITARTGYPGATCVVPERYEGAQSFTTLITRPKRQLVRSDYLNCYINSEGGQRFFETNQIGGGQKNVNAGSLKLMPIPIPPLPEQQVIAETLSDIDVLISSLNQLITKKRNIKQGAMQQLLTGNKRLAGFSDKWEVKTIGEAFRFLSTGNNSRSELSEHGKIKYIHYGDIHSKKSLTLDCAAENIPLIEEYKVKRLPFLEDGDLVMADASEDYEGLGKSVEVKNIAGNHVVAGLHTLLLRGDKNIVADGFKAYITSIKTVKEALIRIATGISVYGISKSKLKTIELLLPETSEQRAIAIVLNDMDAEIEQLEAQREKYRAVKQGMMQELLTGRTRLI